MSSLGDSGLDQLLADMEGLTVEAVVPTPPPAARGKSTVGGEAAKRLTTLFRSPSAFAESARFATEGASATECMGLIGKDGRRFCIIQGCDTKHRGGKFEAPSNHLFIKSSSTEAFCAPSVDAAKVPTGQMADMLVLSKQVPEWVDVFSVLDSAEDEVSLGEVERKLEFLGQAKAHRTPVKGQRLSESAFAARHDLEDILEEIPDEIIKASSFRWSHNLPEDFTDAVEVLGRTVNGLSSAVPSALAEASVRVAAAKESMEDLYDQVNARLISLEGSVGSRRESDKELPPTLWEAASSMWPLLSEPTTPATAASTPAGAPLDSGRVIAAIDAVRKQLAAAKKDREHLSHDAAAYEHKSNRLFTAISTRVSSVVQAQNDLTREVNQLAASGRGSASGNELGGLDSLLASLDGTPKGDATDVADLQKEVGALRAEVRGVKDKDSDKSVSVAGLFFRNKEDFAAWLHENAPGIPFGPVVDWHGFMQQVYHDMGGYESVESLLKSLKLKSDMKLTTTGDILALASIRSGIPQVLGEGKAPTGEDRSEFHAFHTFADWKQVNGRDGFVNKLPTHQQQAKEAIKVDIETRLEPGSSAAMLASTCLTKSAAFSDAFVNYLTQTYEDLTQTSGFPKKRAWALTTSLGARVCKEVHKNSTALARSLSVSNDDTDRDRLTVSLLWATLKAHVKMEEYIQAEFKDHPTIASEYVKFLATNSGYETVGALQTKIDSLEKELATFKRSVTNAANAADSAKKVAAEAKKIAEKK